MGPGIKRCGGRVSGAGELRERIARRTAAACCCAACCAATACAAASPPSTGAPPPGRAAAAGLTKGLSAAIGSAAKCPAPIAAPHVGLEERVGPGWTWSARFGRSRRDAKRPPPAGNANSPSRGSRGGMKAARSPLAERQFLPAPARSLASRNLPCAAAPRRRRSAHRARAAGASRTRRVCAARLARAAAARRARLARPTAGAAGGAAWRRRRATAASRR